MTRTTEQAMLRDHLKVLRRRWIWLAMPFVLVMNTGALWGASREPVYEASAQVLVGHETVQDSIGNDTRSASFASRRLSNEISLARSDLIAERVIAVLGYRPGVNVRGASESDLLTFVARSNLPEVAAEHANVWAQQYVELKSDEALAVGNAAAERLRTRLDELRAERDTLQEPLVELQSRLATASTEAGILAAQRTLDRFEESIALDVQLLESEISAVFTRAADLQVDGEFQAEFAVRLIDAAAAPSKPIGVPTWVYAIAGGVFGLMAGIALAFLRETLDGRLRDAEDLAELTDIPVLGVIPTLPRRIAAAGATVRRLAGTPASHSFNRVRSALQYLMSQGEMSTVLITSANEGEGKTTVASNLGAAFAAAGRPTAVLDTDLHHPRLHSSYGLPQEPGLGNFVMDEVPLREVIHTRAPGLSVLTAGMLPPRPADFLASSSMADVLDEVSSSVDYLVLDSAPVTPLADTLSLATNVDGVVLAVRAGSTKRSELTDAIASLEDAGANVMGIVIVGGPQQKQSKYYETSSSQTSSYVESSVTRSDAPVDQGQLTSAASGGVPAA